MNMHIILFNIIQILRREKNETNKNQKKNEAKKHCNQYVYHIHIDVDEERKKTEVEFVLVVSSHSKINLRKFGEDIISFPVRN